MTEPTEWARTVYDGHVAYITIGAPDGPNRLNVESTEAWRLAVANAAELPDVRVIVICTDRTVWNVGGDLAEMRLAGNEAPALIEAIGRVVNPLAVQLHSAAKITVAAVQGAVAGGALGLMCACDLVIAAEDTIFTQGYARLGANPDAGVSWFLPRIIGYRKALELYLSSARLTAHEAQALGLVNYVVPTTELRAATADLAERIAALAPSATVHAKRLFRSALNVPLDIQLETEIQLFAQNAATKNFAEGLSAFFDHRDPHFG